VIYWCKTISEPKWKLIREDSTVEEFIDIRRKVGNQIIRAYLLKGIIGSDRVQRVLGKLRGPRDEFKDFADFLIVQARNKDFEFQVLAEAGVYENLRVVATNSKELAQWSSDEVIHAFTNALEKPETSDTILILSTDSRIG
jgi:hypothetical protein